MEKIPVVGDYFVREVPPEDNVSALMGLDKILWVLADDIGLFSHFRQMSGTSEEGY